MPPPTTMLRQLRVLIVDDSSVDAHLICRTLNRASVQTHAARVSSALELNGALLEGADIVLTEVGADAIGAHEVRLIVEAHGAAPVVLVANADDIGEPAVWLDEGFTNVVAKEQLHRLPQVVRAALGIAQPAPAFTSLASDLHVSLDAERRIRFADARWRDVLGYEQTQLIGAPIEEFFALDSRVALEQAALLAEGKRFELAIAMLAVDGERVEFDAVFVAREGDGSVKALDGALRPKLLGVRPQKLLERCRALEEQSAQTPPLPPSPAPPPSPVGGQDTWVHLDERLELAGFASDDGVWDWRIEEDEVFYSSRWGALVGGDATARVAGPDAWFSRVLPDDLDVLDEAIGAHLQGEAESVDVEFRVCGDDGDVRRVRCRGRAKRDTRGRAVQLGGAISPVRRGPRDELATTPAMDRIGLAEALRVAMQQDELALHFQPIVDVRAGTLVAVEALARWDHPTRGRIPPTLFMGAAEAHDLIEPIGAWVLDAACCQHARWRATGVYGEGVRMAVNVHPAHLLQPSFVTLVRDTLARHALPAAALELELTESALIDDSARVARTLKALRALGVAIAVDDFGTGFSSFIHLHEFAVDTLKIDRMFVQRMLEDTRDEAIVTALVQLGRALGVAVVAEGVETDAVHQRLRSLGCPRIQGFLIARPQCADDFERGLREERSVHPGVEERPCTPERLP